MVVVRESPRAQVSPSKNNAQWPPRSPFQALLSSPSGRKKWQDYKSRNDEERSPSPSPGRNNVRSSQMLQDLAGGANEDGDDEDEDEETLQLKLAEIQAKLRLKKLQRSGSQKSKDGGRRSEDSSSMPPPRSASPRKLYESALPQHAIQVPLSPSTDRIRDPELSPARARLGLTSNPRAADVSLKRPRDLNQIKRSTSLHSLRTPREEPPKVPSFSQRLAESKQKEDQRQAKQERLKEVRSTGFGHARTESMMSSLSGVSSRSQPASIGRSARSATVDHGASAGRTPGKHARGETSTSRPSSTRQSREEGTARAPVSKMWAGSAGGADNGTGHEEPEDETIPDVQDTGGSTGYDPYSKTHLKKRHIGHEVVAREMAEREVYSLPRLLREVKSPDYDPPDCEADYVVFAVLASKSSPFDHAQTHRTNDKHGENQLEAPKNKFMVLHLCDLKWEIDCFLFGTAFNQFWKLTPGTLLAIMNPAILPPKGNQHNGKFSLKLGSSEDCVMEIGVARDLGYCSAIKKNGEPCGEWIDKRKAEACEFHLNLQIEKARKGRMEVNTMFNDGTKEDVPQRRRIARGRPGERSKKDPKGVKHHREYGTLYSVSGTQGAASLLDDDDKRLYDDVIGEEASRKRIAAAQKDRDIAKQLGEMGHGIGAEMMRNSKHVRTTSTTTKILSTAEEAREALFSKKSAAELGLLPRKSSEVSLEPAKDRKKHFGLGALSMSNRTTANKSSSAMGWGGAKKAGLLQPKENHLGSPERGQSRLDETRRSNLIRPRSQDSSIRSTGSQSPTKKKARFMLDKGIREPGRESLPGQAQVAAVESDDDDLDIV
ncbi:Putative minichromosome maintenance protein [Septoria linicola]|uniref:Minichromosome maintenance protein n=1 Tax=Septoria linicola TaxID=215465 RepID=A0A9Q9AV80_9PEZI|nr:Putative minichromosome maintenance protein [Septoria linicola]